MPEEGAPVRSALVTGASRGIGLAITRQLTELGIAVTAIARDLDALRDAVAGFAPRVHPVRADVTREEDVVAAVRAHRERFGRLDVLVNNAGLGPRVAIEEISTKTLDLVLSINLRAVALTYRECLPLLLAGAARSGGALVVNVASIAGRQGIGGMTAYSAAKHGVAGFTSAANAEVAARGVRSCAIFPAYVDTPGAAGVHDEIPPASMLAPQDVAEAVRFLLQVSPACAVTDIVMEQSARLS